ncbi:TPA: hypothetical protein N0F65_010895 [Lagenidium giganteum]|uniref:Nicastrin n=1 Tax=Lagenidium giganteum TaxID=4803 RepID=A0AAV2YGN2_9STRA|nr:TPA: hypothetical protein N0F65_010895 [Lagenidium giganteum]
MRVNAALALIVCAAATASTSHYGADAAAVKAGAPEQLLAQGGECFRAFHSTGDVGCRSLTKSDMAVLYPVRTAEDLATFVEKKASGSDKYSLVMPEDLFSYDALEKSFGSIRAVFVYPDVNRNTSMDTATPQGAGTPDEVLNPFAAKKVKWNGNGTGLMTRTLPFSVVLPKDAKVGDKFLQRADTNVKAGSAVTYKSFTNFYFGPEKATSLTCLSFKNIYGKASPKCDPIGGQSVWAVRGNTTAKEIVVAMASMDANGFSHTFAPGANTGASGLVALLAAAQALQAIPDEEFDKKVVFAAFQAEKFGFVGSRRFLSDIKQFSKDVSSACKQVVKSDKSPFGSSFCTSPVVSNLEFANLDASKISYAIAVDQVGVLPTNGKFSVHFNPNADNSTKFVGAITDAPSAGSSFSLGTTGALPPTPLLSFVNDKEFGQKDLTSAVIAGYDGAFSGTGLYNSRHDLYTAVDPANVVKAAQVLAEALYKLSSKNASESSMKSITVNEAVVKNMIQCVSSNWTCTLMKDYSKPMVKSMIDYLDLSDSAWPTYRLPVSLYSGPMGDDRQSLVMTRPKKDKPYDSYYADYDKSWSEDNNRLHLFPNAYEVFTRSFLSAAMVTNATADKAAKCSKLADCSSGQDCVYPGICTPRNSYFHDSFSPGLKRNASPHFWQVLNESMPLWTEPRWDSDITAYVFPDPGAAIGWIALGVGIVITGAGMVLARLFLGSVRKMKLL